MTPNIQRWVRENRPRYAGHVLEIGSLNVNGGVRQFFTDSLSYTGIDIVMGNGVDLVLNANNLAAFFDADQFDTILCLETIEHDKKFWRTMAEIQFVLKRGGYLIVSSPTIDFPLHHEPDYWRFTETGIKEVVEMANCDLVLSDKLDDTIGKHSVIAKGVKR